MKKILSIDAETNGLWGLPFAIAATVTDESGNETAAFALRCPDTNVTVQWVKDNVLPHIQDIPLIKEDQPPLTPYALLLREFAQFYHLHRQDAVIIAHCPFPVEAGLFREMHSKRLIGDFEGPFPFIGIEGLLDAKNEPTTQATEYMVKHDLPLPAGSPHNPLYDCRVATTMYRHLKGW